MAMSHLEQDYRSRCIVLAAVLSWIRSNVEKGNESMQAADGCMYVISSHVHALDSLKLGIMYMR